MFDKATKLKLRWESAKGNLTTEDLWDLPLTGQISLDSLAKAVNRKLKESEEESFVETRSKADATLDLKLDILKHIIAVKKEEREAILQAKENAVAREKILRALAEKQDESLKGKSEKELEEMLDGISN